MTRREREIIQMFSVGEWLLISTLDQFQGILTGPQKQRGKCIYTKQISKDKTLATPLTNV